MYVNSAFAIFWFLISIIHKLSSPGFNTYSIPIESPGWFPNSQLPPSALPPPYNTELPSIHVQSQPQSHPEVVPLVASPDTRTRGRCPDPQETIQTQMTQRCRDRQPSHPRPTPYSQSSPQIERRAQTTHHSKEQHISVTTSRHSRSPRPTNTDLSESSSRAYESYTSSFPLQPPSDSTTTPLPLEAHLFEFPAQPSTGQRSLSLKVPSASHTNRSHSRANHRQRQSATFAVDPGFDDSPVTRTGVVPLPQGLGIQTKTKRKVEFKVAGHLGVKLADALREDFTLDQPDEAVLPSESDRQIHLCVMVGTDRSCPNDHRLKM